MGLFGSSAPSSIPAPKVSTDGTPIAPDRSARQKCWDARDTYFACLDKHGIVDSIRNKEEAEKACPREGDQLAGNCASSWITHFKQRRVMEYQREQQLKKLREEGALQLPPGVGPIPPDGPVGMRK